MRIRDIYAQRQFGLSIEIFPPKTPEGDEALRQTLRELAPFGPAFVSCTYGAGGSTSKRTVEWCREIQEQFSLAATAHFTCVGSTRNELVEWLQFAWKAGIRNIMALRGDAPAGQTEFKAVDGGLGHANELVTLIREQFPEMGIGVAGYPEKHPEASDLATDLRNLKQKVDCGADAVYTQLFFDNSAFLRFREQCERAGVRIPIIPGIMPITEFSRIQRITAMCGAKIPAGLAARLEEARDDKSAQFEIGVDFAIQQCRELIDQGVSGIHLYVLNKSHAGQRILDAPGSPAGQSLMTDDLPGFHFGSWSKRLMPLGRIVRVPADMRRKQTLLELLAKGLSLPEDFAWHWDSFCDCLKDLSWLDKPPQAAIVHADIPFLQHSAQRAPYFAALREATEWWAEQGTGELIVAFPAEDEAEVRRILENL